jgi:hypothetical protein
LPFVYVARGTFVPPGVRMDKFELHDPIERNLHLASVRKPAPPPPPEPKPKPPEVAARPTWIRGKFRTEVRRRK